MHLRFLLITLYRINKNNNNNNEWRKIRTLKKFIFGGRFLNFVKRKKETEKKIENKNHLRKNAKHIVAHREELTQKRKKKTKTNRNRLCIQYILRANKKKQINK